ncbi:MAG: SH3 domain-containing protein [Clostridia bacterium]|nr:SH3 domain-containing protein [Clostridia bacterium]
MDKIRITFILILTCVIIIGTTCLAATGIVNATRGLVLREEASKTANPITTVPDDAQVEIIEKTGEWYKVKYGNYEGYLFAEYVKAQEETKPESTIPEQNNEDTKQNEEQTVATEITGTYPQNINIAKEVKVYIIPSITSRVILNIPSGKTITLNYELNNWFNITYEGKEYWVRKNSLNINKTEENKNPENNNEQKQNQEKPKAEENKSTVTENKKGYIDVSSAANVRKSADISADVITTLLRNTEVKILGEEGDFYKIQYQDITGYISKSLVSDKQVEVTSRKSSGERKVTQNTTEEVTSNTEQSTEKQENNTYANSGVTGLGIASYAKQYVGYSYTYGGTTPSTGFDCSGFVYYVYNSCGISLSRSCSVQMASGTAVSKENLQAGDIIFFNNGANGSIGHVGIYIGDGKIVHAKNSNSGVTIDSINGGGYYDTYYYSARRIVN